LLMITSSLFALLIGIPPQIRAIAQLRDLPSGALQATTKFGILQNLVLAIVATSFGILYGRQADLHAPVFESFANGLSPWQELQTQLIPAVVIGIISGFGFVVLYFGILRSRIDSDSAIISEKVRIDMGAPARILIGGIHEEIVFRWGVMGLFAWAGMKMIGGTTPSVIWTANLLAGLIFGLAHLPGIATLGIEPTRAFITTSLILNLAAGTVFGWLFWQYGLFAAMIAHGLYHIILFPFERYFIDR